MSTQLNIKLDPKLKKQAEETARQLGFNVSSLTRAFLMHLVRTKRIDFSLADDTPAGLIGSELEQEMKQAGYDPKHAKQHGQVYDAMLAADKKRKLTEW